ncbi:nucleoside/nucleotide kinase family protein [uncultured Amnibacterium sp.]|uniref:nucleoside/nucleotide kinase family protein n=1 Tax=uncultured Amnibacterium sp. TaxID=1631851 RepID=UPI0035CB9250
MSDLSADSEDVARALADALADRSRVARARLIVGIVGAPGTGKSTLAGAVALHLGHELCRTVSMDGFHLGQRIIDGTELANRKGAPDTFDVGGYVSLLGRLRANSEDTVYAPVYRREWEEPVAASVAIPSSVPIVLTEGNYLLLDHGGWEGVRGLLDDTWYVDTPAELRRSRLIARHVLFGKTPEAARRWTDGPDERNAQMILATRVRAGRIVTWDR